MKIHFIQDRINGIWLATLNDDPKRYVVYRHSDGLEISQEYETSKYNTGAVSGTNLGSQFSAPTDPFYVYAMEIMELKTENKIHEEVVDKMIAGLTKRSDY